MLNINQAEIEIDRVSRGNSEHFFYAEFSNTFRLSNNLGGRYFNIIRTSSDFIRGELFPLIISEFKSVLAEDGIIIISYSYYDLSKELAENRKQIERNFTVEISTEENEIRLRKVSEMAFSLGDISEWTFGAITSGHRNHSLINFIDSVRSQGINKFEIIICGPSCNSQMFSRYPEVRYISFDDESERGWITKKKNLIVESANYTNICLIHDRYHLAENWYKGMQIYGNDFDFLSLPQTYGKLRIGDWLEHTSHIANITGINELKCYSYWSKHCYMAGGVNIFKRGLILENKYDESLFWNDKEDLELSRRLVDNGYIHRLNPHSTMIAINSNWKEYNKIFFCFRKIFSRIKDRFYYWKG